MKKAFQAMMGWIDRNGRRRMGGMMITLAILTALLKMLFLSPDKAYLLTSSVVLFIIGIVLVVTSPKKKGKSAKERWKDDWGEWG